MNRAKAFSYYLSSDRINVQQLVGMVCANADKNRDFNLDLEYFKIRIFKKGTVHITITNQELLEKFNIFVGMRKRWLPPTYGKMAYEAMDAEERAVVDAFQGNEAYAKVMDKSDYYLVDTQQLLLAA